MNAPGRTIVPLLVALLLAGCFAGPFSEASEVPDNPILAAEATAANIGDLRQDFGEGGSSGGVGIGAIFVNVIVFIAPIAIGLMIGMILIKLTARSPLAGFFETARTTLNIIADSADKPTALKSALAAACSQTLVAAAILILAIAIVTASCIISFALVL